MKSDADVRALLASRLGREPTTAEKIAYYVGYEDANVVWMADTREKLAALKAEREQRERERGDRG